MEEEGIYDKDKYKSVPLVDRTHTWNESPGMKHLKVPIAIPLILLRTL